MTRRFWSAVAVSATFLAAVPMAVPTGAVQPAPGVPAFADWQQVTPPGKQPAAFTVRTDDLLEITAKDAVSFLYRELEPPLAPSSLSWRWRVERAPRPSELGMPGMDDRPLAVHLWFPQPAAERSFWDGLKSALGYPTFGKALTYVWGGTAPRGAVLANPHLEGAALIILRDGAAPQGTWLHEEVDPSADYTRVFGHPPPSPPRYIAISADTDDKGGTAIALVTDLRFGR